MIKFENFLMHHRHRLNIIRKNVIFLYEAQERCTANMEAETRFRPHELSLVSAFMVVAHPFFFLLHLLKKDYTFFRNPPCEVNLHHALISFKLLLVHFALSFILMLRIWWIVDATWKLNFHVTIPLIHIAVSIDKIFLSAIT